MVRRPLTARRTDGYGALLGDRRLHVTVLATWLVACGAHSRVAVPTPPAIPSDGALHVVLTWTAPVDLDLYLTDPAGESLYFGNNPTRAGARLAADARCGEVAHAAGVEDAVLTTPAPGRYRVGVDYLDDCGSGIDVVPFAVAVGRGADRYEATGEAQRRAFNVVVLEFEVGEDGRIATPTERGAR